jgi:TonB-linked SusC/RagA family outer membrane protein
MRKMVTIPIGHLPARMCGMLPLVMLCCLLFNEPVFATGYYTESYQILTVTGTVTAKEDGSALPGVNIQVAGNAKGTVTNLNGEYSLEIDDPDAILHFSYVGYLSQEIRVNGQLVINVQMVLDTRALEEVVVIGYGTQKKVNLSGAVDVVQSKEIVNRPVANVSQALQGLSPNLNITVGADGGEMGGRMNMDIRGMGSINGGSPYVLVDGIEQDLYKLNPSDIESISVLKDAAASAIYGARAAFGVVLVTTKKGRKDGISLNYSNNYAFATPTRVPHSVNSFEFAEYFNVASVNSGIEPLFRPIIIEYMEKYQRGEIDYWTIPAPFDPRWWLSYEGAWANTDWYEESYKKWVPNNIHNVSVSGGNERTQFYVSGSTFNQEGLLVYGEDSHRRNTVNAKVNTRVYDWLRFSFQSNFSRTNISRPSFNRNDFYYGLARQWPTNAPYYPDGNLSGEAIQIWLEQGGMYNEDQNAYTLVPGVEIEPFKGWIIYANYRWKMNPSGSTNHVAKVYGTDAYSQPLLLSETNYYNMSFFESTYNSPNIYSTYNKRLGKHEFTIMAGFEQELYQYQWSSATRHDLVSDEVPSIPTATGRNENDGGMGHYSTRSFFGRLNYSINEKYLFEVSGRYDGSSKFPMDYRWGVFPSGSAAYIISKEDYWEPLKGAVNLLKIRASYGSLGNQDVDNYLYMERLPFYSSLPYVMADGLPNYVKMSGLISPGITWEKVRTSNIGLDAGFLKNRLNVSFDYFIRNTLDMLGPAESYPTVLGTEVPKSNNAELMTKGFEFVVEWRDRIGEFSYSAKFLLADKTHTITSYYNPEKLLSGAYYEGAQLGEIWGFTTVGLFESDQQAQDPSHDQSYLSPLDWRAGDVYYEDINGDGKIGIGDNTVDNHGDLSIIGNSTPRYTFSALISSSWKGIDFNMLWQGVAKRDLALNGSLFWGMVGSKWWNIGLEEHMDYWTEENTDAYWPRPYYENWEDKNHQTQTRYLQNGAYLRLKSLQIGYTLPAHITQKVKINNLRIYASGENLLTFTKLITVFDPELTGGQHGSGTMYPLQKVLSLGINVTF